MIYVVFHAKSINPFRPCMDGLFAAAIAKMTLPHDDIKLIPAVYGPENAPTIAPGEAERIYLLDLTYPAHQINAWAEGGAEVVILDHHKTAMQDLSGLSSALITTEFDMSRSGAMMAWDYFQPLNPPPKIVRYVQDRDLWTKALPDNELISMGLASMMRPLDLDAAIDLAIWLMDDDISMSSAESKLASLKSTGMATEVLMKSAITTAVSRSKWRLVAGYNIPFVRVESEYEKLAYSDIAHALLNANPNAPFACVETGGGWALRSEDSRLDVSAIAKSLGGGGHRNASGCRSGNPTAWR
jgi:uncharacterized protein